MEAFSHLGFPPFRWQQLEPSWHKTSQHSISTMLALRRIWWCICLVLGVVKKEAADGIKWWWISEWLLCHWLEHKLAQLLKKTSLQSPPKLLTSVHSLAQQLLDKCLHRNVCICARSTKQHIYLYYSWKPVWNQFIGLPTIEVWIGRCLCTRTNWTAKRMNKPQLHMTACIHCTHPTLTEGIKSDIIQSHTYKVQNQTKSK